MTDTESNRITINLPDKVVQDLKKIMDNHGLNKTAAIIYALKRVTAEEDLEAEGGVMHYHYPDGRIERVLFI